MSMTRDKIIAAQAEASRFIKAGNAALSQLNAESQRRDEWNTYREERGISEPRPPAGPQPDDYSYGSAETGALRRASMDLTRSLAVLRK